MILFLYKNHYKGLGEAFQIASAARTLHCIIILLRQTLRVNVVVFYF